MKDPIHGGMVRSRWQEHAANGMRNGPDMQRFFYLNRSMKLKIDSHSILVKEVNPVRHANRYAYPGVAPMD